MRNIFWMTILVCSIAFMILGFSVSFHGIETGSYDLVYAGLIVIGTTCVSWWIWVMIVIKDMYSITVNAIDGVKDIRTGIKEVKRLIQEYKNLTER